MTTVLLTIGYFLETYSGIIHVNSALAKAEMNTIKSSVDVLINPSLSNASDAKHYRPSIPFSVATAEVAELNNLRKIVIRHERLVRNYTLDIDRRLSLLHIEGELSSRIVAHYAETGNRRAYSFTSLLV